MNVIEALEVGEILWAELANKGHVTKQDAIKILVIQGKLSKEALIWRAGCPFCELCRNWILEADAACDNCPWPGTGAARCEDFGSPYQRWARARTVEQKQNAAQDVWKLIYELLIKARREMIYE